MNAQDFLTNVSLGYVLLMVAVVLTAIFVSVSSKKNVE